MIITPFFAPQSHAAMFRAHKLAKYLPDRSWKVHVLTTDINYHFFEDASLLSDLKDVEITRARYIEPTLRGLRMALGGKDRTSSALQKETKSSQDPPPATLTKSPSFPDKVYEYLLKRYLQVPDAYWTWKWTAYQAAKKLIEDNNIPIVMTSSFPYSTLELGLALQKNLGIKWVADFRDVALTYDHTHSSTYPKAFIKQRDIEKQTFAKADRITSATSAGPLIAADMFGSETAKKIHFIPTGADEALFPSGTLSPQRPYLIFTGEYLRMYGDEFLKIFLKALQIPGVRESEIKVRIIGRVDINQSVLGPDLEKLGLTPYFEFLDHLPQSELYKQIRGAKAAVLPLSTNYSWWRLSAKLVDFIALQSTVLARVPDPSEARKWLTRSRLGIFMDGNIEEAAIQLASVILDSSDRPRPDELICQRFVAKKQVADFSDLFESLL